MNSTKNAVIVLLALTTVAGVGLAWRQHRELVELRSAGSGDARADWQKQIADLEQTNRELQDRLAAARGERPSGDSAADATGGRAERGDSPGRGRGPGNRGSEFTAMRELMAKPEVQALVTSTRKAAIDQQYAALFRSLNLPPEQADKLKSLLAERQNTFQDVMSAAREQGVDPRADRDGLRQVVTDAENAVNSSIKSLLGDDGYAKFTNYEQTAPQRNVVNVLQQRLSASDAPLTSAQADQLVQILASTTPPPASSTSGTTSPAAPPEGPGFGPRGDFGGRMGGMLTGVGGGAAAGAPITNDAVAQAQTILNQQQLGALQQLQQQQQTAQQLQQLLRSSLPPNNPSTSTPAASPGNTGTRTGGRRPGG